MNKITFFLLAIITFKSYSQHLPLRGTPAIKSKIIYKNGSSDIGFLWLASSEFYPRLKKEKKGKSKKINYKEIDLIITNPDSTNSRTFQYLNHNYNKFKIFVELIYKDNISIYVASKRNGSDLFYSDYDRETTREKLSKTNLNYSATKPVNTSQNHVLSNGNSITVSPRYSDLSSFSKAYNLIVQHYILKENSTTLIKVENNKRFLKKSKDYFKDCPELINDLELKKINLSNLVKFINHYNKTCKTK
ncbi:hypothetical protein ACKGJY_03625 [Hyunsoonleella sp. 2307UL5-6]|uniref:hypothetical protein n=1 Tax=Hyunsoonleella sp. 2307UL5-6 TaxID=3384768 RepID=UPI0039BC674F